MPPTDERKLVTVLFADLVGSTELATRQDPEPLRALLSAFFDEMRQQIEAYGGTVEKYAGDAVMAVFGVPHVHEDDAERAVRAAVAMRDALAQLNPMFEQEYGVRLSLRIGVATGEAVAASRAVSQFMVTGEVPNLAARLQSVTEGITLSEETHRVLGPLLDAERVGPYALKGFPEPVTGYRLASVRAAEFRPRGIPGLSSPVVGRDDEMATLRGCVEDLRRGRGQVVSIVGEAGIGKSRLKIEIRDNLPHGIRWLEGRCHSYTQSTSYAPIIQIVRSALGLGPAEGQAIARAKLRVGLRELVGARADQALGALAHLLGIDVGPGSTSTSAADPRALQSQLVLAVRAILEGLALRGGVIAAIEDLHWADAATLELLTVLVELTDFHPLMILVTSRPETEGDAWTFRLHAERNYAHRLTDLRLRPLRAEESQRLADNLLRGSELPEAVRGRILERAEGNPFFLEEVIRALIEQGVLRRDGDRWVASRDPDRWPIPATLRGVLAARIDRLPAPAKAVLQRASVVGRFFENRTVQALGDDAGEIDRALADLLRAELIREWARLPERQYVFKHALTQEAAYASMLADQRKALHAGVARHVEQTLGDKAPERAALLAHHWDGAEDWERALHYTLLAADRARALYARPEAIGHYTRARELLRRLPATDERRRMHTDVIIALAEMPGSIRDRAGLTAALHDLQQAAEYAASRGDGERLVRAEALQGFLARDEATARRAIERARAVGSLADEAFAVERYGAHLGMSGRWDEALAHFSRAIEIHGALGARFQQAMCITSGGRCYGARAGSLDESLRHASRFRAIAEELGDARLRAWRAMEAEPYFYKGLWEDVIRVAEESLPTAWEIGEWAVVIFASAWLGLAHLKIGRRDDARRVIERARQEGEVRSAGMPFALAYITVARVLAHLADGESEPALALAPRALDLAERSRFRLEQGAAHRALAQAHAAVGDRPAAETAYRRSLEILEEIQSLPELGQTLLAYGRFKSAENPAEGSGFIERARTLFAQIGATGWLAEAQAALRVG